MRKKLPLFSVVLLCCLLFPLNAQAYGYTYHPPAITVILLQSSAGAEMEVTLVPRVGEPISAKLEKERRAWENCYRLYRYAVVDKDAWYGNTVDFKDAVITVTDNGESYSFPVPYEQLKQYDFNDYLLIDLKAGTIRAGLPASRRWAITFMHLALYLLVEGIVLYLFQIRSRRNWTVFFVSTVLTKGIVCFAMNYCINVDPRINVVFAFATCFLIAIDMSIYLIFMEEEKNKIGKYAVTANIIAAQIIFEAAKYLPM